MTDEVDYIVIGSGSAGSVIAARLAAQADTNVALFEAGPPASAISIRMPAAVSINIKGKRYNWRYQTEPQEALAGRILAQPRGRVLGGSSSINGMIFIRGHAFDYDRWVMQGARGWSYFDVLPYFKRLESFRGKPSAYRGTGGPVPVNSGWASNPLHEAFLAAAQQAGHALTDDVNGYQQAGVGYFDKNIDGGERWSAARSYGCEVGGTRLQIFSGSLVTRILVEHGCAIGVQYLKSGSRRTLYCRREVVVCAGAFESPKLLMLSGIGPPQELQRHGIEIIAEAPEVGENLQDHTEVHVQYHCTEPITLYGDLSLARRLCIGAEWMLRRSGKGATNHYETGAFLKSTSSVTHPDIQLHFVPIVYNNSVERHTDCHGFRVHAGPVRSPSRGWLRLASNNPLDPPRIQPRYFSEKADWMEMRAAIEHARCIFAQKAFDRYRGKELSPGPDVKSIRDIDAFIRATGDTGYHPAGTCRMGSDATAVVDPEGKVRGVEALRVVDASIMPSIVSGNLNAPVMMMAERISDLLLGRVLQPPEVVAVYESSARR